MLVLRDGADGPEVFMVRRHEGTGAFRGAHVFPGGRVDAEDAADEGWCDGVDQARRQLPDLPPAEAVAFHVCAARELFEEAGVLLARDRSGALVSLADSVDRSAVQAIPARRPRSSATLREMAEREGLRLALDPLTRYAHWVTPPVEGRRFDTRFFVTRVPPLQTAAHDETETTEGGWITAAAALDAAAGGGIMLPPPTWMTLRELKPFASVDEIRYSSPRGRWRTIDPKCSCCRVPADRWRRTTGKPRSRMRPTPRSASIRSTSRWKRPDWASTRSSTTMSADQKAMRRRCTSPACRGVSERRRGAVRRRHRRSARR